DAGQTLRGVAEELYRRGVASPGGKAYWSRNTLRELLTNKSYLGCYRWGESSQGKFLTTSKGKIRPRSRDEKRERRNPEEDWVLVPGHHEPLVDIDLFQRVQQRLQKNQKHNAPHPGGGPFLLSRLLICAHCGFTMVGRHN